MTLGRTRGRLPRELHIKAAAAGILGLRFPEEYGGHSAGFDVFHSMVQSEELAAVGAGGLSASLMTHGIGLPPVLALGSDELKQRVAPAVLSGEKIIALAITEAGGGSDVAAITTRADRHGDTYVVNGGKMFITSGMRADFVTTAVRTGVTGTGGISLLLIEAGMPGFTRTPLEKMGVALLRHRRALFRRRGGAGGESDRDRECGFRRDHAEFQR